MNEGSGRTAPAEERIAALRARMEASRFLHEMPKPTIAAIEGPAAGAGLSLALACDFRVCSRTAKLTTAFAKVGLSGDYGGTYFLTHILGPAKARELYLLSPVLTGEQAKAIGLVTEIAEPGHVLEAAIGFAAPLAEGPTVTLGRIKQNLALAAGGGSLAECFDQEARNHIQCSQTADHKEAAAAFVEKRRPVFVGGRDAALSSPAPDLPGRPASGSFLGADSGPAGGRGMPSRPQCREVRPGERALSDRPGPLPGGGEPDWARNRRWPVPGANAGPRRLYADLRLR
jgi:2-(1,2-epoxy-1,2-dihydrophenyl)acetyl-CoA isomerase